MKEKLSFEADAAIITRLGRELVAKQETALIELVKNAFDADATQVEVILHGSAPTGWLEIRDNGSGMTREELINGFLRIASDMKVKSPVSPLYKRQRAGRKGLGRFSTQRLGEKLALTTQVDGAQSALKLTVDWTKFKGGKPLEDVTVDLEEVPAQANGTTIRIERLLDQWSPSQLRRCWRGVLALQQPFPVAPIAGEPKADPGFTVRFLRDGGLFQDETLVADLQTEILNHLHAIIEMKVDNSGRASWRISKNRFGPTREWAPIHHEHRDAPKPPAYVHLRNAWLKAHYVILAPDLLPSIVYSRLRDVLADEGGIRLYRNGFRVVPYGDPEDDWLRLDELYAKRSLLAPIANRNFFGVIEVHDPQGTLFEEHTSREGLIETPAFLELRDLASSVLVTAATNISEDRGRKTRAGTPSRPKAPATSALDEVGAAVIEAQKAAEQAAGGTEEAQRAALANTAAKKAAEAVRLIEEKKEEIEAVQARLADESAMLRFLATIGMTTAEFSHETGMTFDAFRLDFEQVFKTALASNQNDETFLERADRARAMLNRLDTLTSYLNSLAAARSARGMSPLSLSKMLKDFEQGVRAQAQSQNIDLVVQVPAYDPLFTQPLHQAEIASILLNFYTNAVKAMKRSGKERKILAIADRIEGSPSRVRIRFSDTGDGIPEKNRDRIFDPFFTTRSAPKAGASDMEHASGTGLGLWIVSQIANNAGGEVEVIDAPDGYSTCFELLLPAEDEQ